jgi:hypothetical protein
MTSSCGDMISIVRFQRPDSNNTRTSRLHVNHISDETNLKLVHGAHFIAESVSVFGGFFQ